MINVKQFSQNDPRWKSHLLGADKISTIGNYGCLLTSLAMCAAYYGRPDITPDSLNAAMVDAGGFDGAFIAAQAIRSVVPGMTVDYRECKNTPAPMTEIDADLAAGYPVIVEVDYSPAPGLQTHYMVLVSGRDGGYQVIDPYPYPPQVVELSASKYVNVANTRDVSKIVTGVLFTCGFITQPSVPDQAESFAVYSTADALALRSSPEIPADASANLVNRYQVGAKFSVLESEADASAKIGKPGQWLHVQSEFGAFEGYVAAWFVERRDGEKVVPGPTLEERVAECERRLDAMEAGK